MNGTRQLGLENFKHLDDAILLSLMDGELANAEQKRAEEHLAACWTCRDRQTQMQATIGTFLSVRETLRPENISSVPAPVEQFRQRLSRHVEEQAAGRAGWFGAFVGILESWREGLRAAAGALVLNRQAALAAVVIAVVLVVTFTDVLSTTASAETLLRRAEGFESGHLPEAGSVGLRSVRMEHINSRRQIHDFGTLEFAKDDSGSVYVSTASEAKHGMLVRAADQSIDTSKLIPREGGLPVSVEHYLQAEHWLPDVSVPEFRKLVVSRQSTATTSKREGGAYEVSYPFAENHISGILEARLAVDARTYEPESVSIVTSEAGEFRFTRVAESSAPRTTEWARIFDAPSLASSRPHTTQSLPGLTKLSPLTYANSVASEQEVAAAAALHKLDACMGEEVYVFPMSDGTILVQGLVDRPERRDAIRSALHSLRFPVTVQVFTPKELVGGAMLFPPPDQLAAATLPRGSAGKITIADASGREIPLYDEISRHVMKPGITDEELHQRVASFSNEAVTLSRQALLHAWALRRLETEFSERRVAQLPPGARQEAERLRTEHRQAISKLTRRQAELLASGTGRPQVAPGTAEPPQDAETLLRLAQRQNQLMRRLFTVSEPVDDSQASLNDLFTTLHQISR